MQCCFLCAATYTATSISTLLQDVPLLHPSWVTDILFVPYVPLPPGNLPSVHNVASPPATVFPFVIDVRILMVLTHYIA